LTASVFTFIAELLSKVLATPVQLSVFNEVYSYV
jgi:hypothetical protein